jgi:hypothetical protein
MAVFGGVVVRDRAADGGRRGLDRAVEVREEGGWTAVPNRGPTVISCRYLINERTCLASLASLNHPVSDLNRTEQAANVAGRDSAAPC